MNFPDFQDQRVKIYKNRKMKNTVGFLKMSRVIKKTPTFAKCGNFVSLDDFRVR